MSSVVLSSGYHVYNENDYEQNTIIMSRVFEDSRLIRWISVSAWTVAEDTVPTNIYTNSYLSHHTV